MSSFKIFILWYVLPLLLTIALLVFFANRDVKHECIYPHCPMIDQIEFNGCGECLKYSPCWALDSVHFKHPSWDYDRTYEEYLHINDTATCKYKIPVNQ